MAWQLDLQAGMAKRREGRGAWRWVASIPPEVDGRPEAPKWRPGCPETMGSCEGASGRERINQG